METILQLLDGIDLVSAAIGVGSTVVLFLLTKAPAKVKEILKGIFNKVDEELDKEDPKV